MVSATSGMMGLRRRIGRVRNEWTPEWDMGLVKGWLVLIDKTY